MSTRPYWFKLLQYQRARGKTGLTIPFLIGAVRPAVAPAKMGEAEAYAEVQGLLASLRDDVSDSNSVVIKECNEFHIPIAALYLLEHGQADCESVKGRNNEGSRLFMQRSYFAKRRRTIEAATEGLWEYFDTHLVSGEFSYREGKYVPFNDEDLDFIEKAYAYTEPNYSRWRV